MCVISVIGSFAGLNYKLWGNGASQFQTNFGRTHRDSLATFITERTYSRAKGNLQSQITFFKIRILKNS